MYKTAVCFLLAQIQVLEWFGSFIVKYIKWTPPQRNKFVNTFVER